MKAFLRTVAFPSIVLTFFFVALRLDRWLGWRGVRLPEAGVPLLIVGLAIIVWTNSLFLTLGEGTAHPFAAKTRRLVILGPYRYVRNPMMWGVGLSIVGAALWLGSAGLWVLLAVFLSFVGLFVPFYEERDMERRFGEEYRQYCRQVSRWWPRFP